MKNLIILNVIRFVILTPDTYWFLKTETGRTAKMFLELRLVKQQIR